MCCVLYWVLKCAIEILSSNQVTELLAAGISQPHVSPRIALVQTYNHFPGAAYIQHLVNTNYEDLFPLHQFVDNSEELSQLQRSPKGQLRFLS